VPTPTSPPTPDPDSIPVHIYALSDPRTGVVRYVGKSWTIRKRLTQHLSAARTRAKKGHVYSWLRSLLREGVAPALTILETVSAGGPWQEREKHWIQYFRQSGVPLTNLTDGGDGTHGLHSPLRGIPLSDLHRQHVREGRRNGTASPGFKGHKHTPVSVAKMSMVRVGKKQSIETRKKRAEANRGRVHTTEELEKMRGPRRETCIKGHVFDTTNSYVWAGAGGRHCRKCRAEAERRRYAKRKERQVA